MTTSAILMMIFSITVLWGGLGVCIYKLMKHNREVGK